MINVAVICDFLEEQWPSMDLVGDMVIDHMHLMPGIHATRIRPAMKFRFSWIPLHSRHSLNNAARVWNRFVEYPRFLSYYRVFDLFHIIDHSYAHLVHNLPANRTVVTCHDIDAFRSVLTPADEPRGPAYRAMTSRILSGLQKAAVVACDSAATRDALWEYRVRPPERTVLAPLGVHPSCSVAPNLLADDKAASLMGAPKAFDILHVGSTIPRKRIDVLLRIFRGVLDRFPQARLIRVGGPFTADQKKLAESLDLQSAVLVLPHLTRDTLAAVYRRVAIVLQPSDREGFGLPVAEAMACGTPVIASDLAVLRELGGNAALYCPPGDPGPWIIEVTRLLTEYATQPSRWLERRMSCVRQAALFTWSGYAAQMSAIYRNLCPTVPVAACADATHVTGHTVPAHEG